MVQQLEARGRELYGSKAFDEITAAYELLTPFMNGDDPAKSLEELVKPLDPSTIRDRAYASGVLVRAVNSTLFDAQHFELAGYTLAERLAATAQRERFQAAKPNPPKFFMSPQGIVYLLMEALQECNLVRLAEPVSLDWPPGGDAGIYGRRVWTGETERPGSNHGFDPDSLPPV